MRIIIALERQKDILIGILMYILRHAVVSVSAFVVVSMTDKTEYHFTRRKLKH